MQHCSANDDSLLDTGLRQRGRTSGFRTTVGLVKGRMPGRDPLGGAPISDAQAPF